MLRLYWMAEDAGTLENLAPLVTEALSGKLPGQPLIRHGLGLRRGQGRLDSLPRGAVGLGLRQLVPVGELLRLTV
jgi:hypothetical protein